MSFIVAFPFEPKNESDLKQLFFQNVSTLPDAGGDEFSVEEIIEELFKQIKKQTSNNKEMVIDRLEGFLIVPYDVAQQNYNFEVVLKSDIITPEEAQNIFEEMEKSESFIYVFKLDSTEDVYQALAVNCVFKNLDHRLVVNY